MRRLQGLDCDARQRNWDCEARHDDAQFGFPGHHNGDGDRDRWAVDLENEDDIAWLHAGQVDEYPSEHIRVEG